LRHPVQDLIIITVDCKAPIDTEKTKASQSVSGQSNRRQCDTVKDKNALNRDNWNCDRYWKSTDSLPNTNLQVAL